LILTQAILGLLLINRVGKRLREAKKTNLKPADPLIPVNHCKQSQTSTENFALESSSSLNSLNSICECCYNAEVSTIAISRGLPPPMSVLAALWINGEILGLKCCTNIPAKSLPTSENVPLPSRPTPTQLLTFHCRGIDRFPFPRMRDKAIGMSGFVDEE
jgi:hypothetical protein